MFKLLGKVLAVFGTGVVALFIFLLIVIAWVTIGALFWGWIIMLLAGATGHSLGFSEAFLWGYIPAILSGI